MARSRFNNNYLTTTKNSQQVVPIFFEKKQLENIRQKIRNHNPQLADMLKIEVVGTLEELITYVQSNNDVPLNFISLVPSSEVLALLRQNRTVTITPASKNQYDFANIHQMQHLFRTNFLR